MANISFDDLIPKEAPAQEAISFDDLIPAAEPMVSEEPATVEDKPKGAFKRIWESLRTTKPGEATFSPTIGRDILEGIKTETKEGFKQAVSNPFNRPAVELDTELHKESPFLARGKQFLEGASQPFENYIGAARAGWSFIGEPIKNIVSKPLERATEGAIPSGATDIAAAIVAPGGGLVKASKEVKALREASKVDTQAATRAQLQDMGIDVSGLGTESAQQFTDANAAVAERMFSSVPVLDSQVTQAQRLAASEELMKGKQEALAQVALGARNPYTRTAEQIAKVEPQTSPLIDDIQKNIDADIVRLQAEKEATKVLEGGDSDLVARIHADIDKEIAALKAEKGATRIVNTELADDQFETNIFYPTQNALDSGVPYQRVEQELRDGLKAAQLPDDQIETLVQRAIPESYKKLDTEIPEVAQTLGIPEPTARGVIPVATPDDGSIYTPLTAEELKLGGSLRSKVADSTNMLSLMGRMYAKKNGINIGSESLRELDDLTAIRNLSQRGSIWWRSIVGNPNGKDKGILWTKAGSELAPDLDIDNFNASIVKAKQAGMTPDELREVINAYNAYDDYANIDRIINSTKQELAQVAPGSKEAKELNKTILEYELKESFMTRDQVAASIDKFKDNAAAQQFLANKNKINRRLLTGLVDVGKISKAEADRILAAHPNYAPAWRDVEDFRYANIEVINSGGTTKPFRFRKISEKDVMDPIQTTTNNIINTVRKIEQTQYRTSALKYLLPKLDDSAWKVLFRENKADVQKALDAIKNGKKSKWSAEEITSPDAGKVQRVGNIVFDVDGGQIQLTIKDPQVFQEFSNARVWESTGPWFEKIEKLAHFTRNFITLNPEFSLRNIQRETMDAMVGARTNLKQKLLFPAQNVKNLFAKDLNPELYDHIANNIGYGSRRGMNLYRLEDVGTTSAELADFRPTKLKEAGLPTKLADKVAQPLESFANRFDMAPRISVYEWTLRDGLASGLTHEKAHEAAIFAARNLGVNFTQRGSQVHLDKLIRTIPFSRSFINSTDRMLMLAKYEPMRLARNTFVGLYIPYMTVKAYNNQFTDANGVPLQASLDPTIQKDVLPIYGPWSKDVNDYFPLRLGWVYGRALPAMEKSTAFMMQEIGSRIDAGVAASIPDILKSSNETKDINPKEVLAAWTDYLTGITQPSSVLPVGLKQVVELSTNTDYQGREIVPSYLQNSPAFAQVKDTTPAVLSDFAYALRKRGIELSPLTTEYLLNSIFASAATYSLQGADFIYSAATGRERPAMEGKDMPFVGLVTGKTSEVAKEGIESQFSNVGKYLDNIQRTRLAIEDRTATDPNAHLDLHNFDIDHALELNYYAKYREARDAIKPYRDMSQRIAKAGKDEAQGYQTPEVELFGDPDKRKAIDDIRKGNIEIMRNFLKEIERNDDAEDIYYERLTRTPMTKGIEKGIKLFEDDDTPPEPPKSTDKRATVYDDSTPGFFEQIAAGKASGIEPASMVNADEPYKPGFLERYFPTIRNQVVSKIKDVAVNKTLELEGGYVNHPRDNGGPTNFGVTLATLRLVNPKATINDVRKMTREDAKRIYTKLYWDDAKVDKVPMQLQDLVFDGNINHGVPGMTRVVQRALNDLGAKLAVDGKMGNKTLNALAEYDAKAVREAILKRRERLYRQHDDFDVFGDGWLDRLTKLKNIPKEAMEA